MATYLLVRLAQRALLERFADIFAAAGEEPLVARGVVHDDDLARGGLDDDHARAEHKVVCPEATVRD